MIRGHYSDKQRVVDILTSSFDDNKSVNYIIKQDGNRVKRIRGLMDSFEMCYSFGKVILSDDRTGCALIMFPDKKRTTLKWIFLNLKLVLSCTGLTNIKKAVDRESKIRKLYPRKPILYFWFLGVDPDKQNSGIGTRLMEDVIKEADLVKRPIYLETSVLKNVTWYEKFGFSVYHKLDFGHKLFLMKKD